MHLPCLRSRLWAEMQPFDFVFATFPCAGDKKKAYLDVNPDRPPFQQNKPKLVLVCAPPTPRLGASSDASTAEPSKLDSTR